MQEYFRPQAGGLTFDRSRVNWEEFVICQLRANETYSEANVTPISKGPPSSSVANYRLISITSVLSKVFQRLVLVRLRQFMERSGAILTTSVLIGTSGYL